MDQADEIESAYRLLQQTRTRVTELSAAAQRVHALERELAPLAEQITRARAQLETEVAAQDHRLQHELSPRVAALPGIEARLGAIVGEFAGLEAGAAQLAADVERQQSVGLEARRMEAENQLLEADGKETSGKLQLLVHHHDDGVACQKWPIVKEGIFVGYSTNREVAHAIGEHRSRGSCRADGWSSVPIVRISNIGLCTDGSPSVCSDEPNSTI